MLRSIDVSARLEGSREELFAILADCERYAAWMPGIELSSVLAREGDVAIAEFRGSRWSDRTFNLEIIHSPPDSIAFRQIDSLDHPEISGRWELAKTEAGARSPSALVRLRMRIETPLLILGSRRRLRAAARAGLDALGARRRLPAPTAPTTAARGQKVLEVVREAGGLKVWYLGESFLMPRAQER